MFIRSILIGGSLVLAASSVEGGIIDRYAAQAVQGQRQVCVPCVRVLVVHDAPSALVQVEGKYIIMDPHRHEVISRRVHGKGKKIEALAQGLKWGEEFPDVYQLKIIPTSSDTVISVNGVPYAGNISIYDVGGSISIVNDVDIEDYVTSMLASKIDRPVPREALAAVAIAQRSEAYYRSSFPRNAYWDIDGVAVGYQGLKPQKEYEAAEDAVDATGYMVLNSSGGVASAEEKVGLFPVHWAVAPPVAPPGKRVVQKKPILLLTEAETRAHQGQNAAQILSGVFPGVTVQRIFSVY